MDGRCLLVIAVRYTKVALPAELPPFPSKEQMSESDVFESDSDSH